MQGLKLLAQRTATGRPTGNLAQQKGVFLVDSAVYFGWNTVYNGPSAGYNTRFLESSARS